MVFHDYKTIRLILELFYSALYRLVLLSYVTEIRKSLALQIKNLFWYVSKKEYEICVNRYYKIKIKQKYRTYCFLNMKVRTIKIL